MDRYHERLGKYLATGGIFTFIRFLVLFIGYMDNPTTIES